MGRILKRHCCQEFTPHSSPQVALRTLMIESETRREYFFGKRLICMLMTAGAKYDVNPTASCHYLLH